MKGNTDALERIMLAAEQSKVAICINKACGLMVSREWERPGERRNEVR
jgi:hypothetical protein